MERRSAPYPTTWLARFGPRRLLLFAEAAAALAAASATLRLVPFGKAISSGAIPLRSGGERAHPDRCVWAIEAAARRVPWRAVCIHQGLAGQRMLRRRGIDARLHYGIGSGEEDALKAHVWVTVGDEIVLGADTATQFAPVASWP